MLRWATLTTATVLLVLADKTSATPVGSAFASSCPACPSGPLSSPIPRDIRTGPHKQRQPWRRRITSGLSGAGLGFGRRLRATTRRRKATAQTSTACCCTSRACLMSSLVEACLLRGGAKVAPSAPQGSSKGGGTSGPVLGPITRRGQTEADKEGEGEGQGQDEFAPQFLDFQSRVGFMKKVYLTVSTQLIYTGLICTLLRGYREPVLTALFTNGMVPQVMFFVGTMATIIGTNATLWMNVEVATRVPCGLRAKKCSIFPGCADVVGVCAIFQNVVQPIQTATTAWDVAIYGSMSRKLRQSFPRNLPLLTAFTTAWALYVGVFSLMFTEGSVTRAIFQAAFIVGSLTAYAFRTNPKHELTQLGAGLYSVGNALGMFILMKLFFFRNHRASDLALSCLATLFFSLFLVYDTYRIIGGKHRRSSQFGVKDWAVAAMALYEDIMQIFIHLLALFGETQR